MSAQLLSRRGLTRHRAASSGTPTPFPTGVSGLAARYEPDMGVTLNGSAVSAWADQSSNGNNLTQSTAAKQPAAAGATLNGVPLLGFNGSQYLNGLTNAGIVGNAFTVFAVVQPSSTTGTPCIASFGPPSGGREYRLSAGKQDLVAANVADVGQGAAVLSAGGSHVVALTYTGSSLQLWRNGSADGAAVSVTQSFNSGNSGVTVGVHPGLTSDMWNGNIGTVLAFGRVLTASEIGQVDSYLGDKYNIAVTDHI